MPYYVYILTNKSNTLYIGVTSNPIKRIHEHKQKKVKGFTEKYNINKLIYIEEYPTPLEAIQREKKTQRLESPKETQPHQTNQPTLPRNLNFLTTQIPTHLPHKTLSSHQYTQSHGSQ